MVGAGRHLVWVSQNYVGVDMGEEDRMGVGLGTRHLVWMRHDGVRVGEGKTSLGVGETG